MSTEDKTENDITSGELEAETQTETETEADAETAEETETAEAPLEAEIEADTEVEAESTEASDETEPESETASDAASVEPIEEAYIDQTTVIAARKKARKKKTKKICLIVLGTVFAVAVAAYLVIAVYFMFHYNRNTYIDGVSRSYASVSSVEADIKNYIDNYSITIITNDDKSYKLSGADIGVNIDTIYGADEIKHDQNGLLWIYYLYKNKSYTVQYEITYDEQMLSDALSELAFMQTENMVPGENAYVDIVDGVSVIVEETEGTVIDTDALLALLAEAITEGTEEISLHDTDCYVEAEVTADSDEIAQIQASADKILGTVISYYIDEVEWELTSETFGDWLYYRNGRWEISDYGIEQYVINMANEYDTVGTDRTFVTYTGRTVTETGKKYGWEIDQETEQAQISLILHSGISQAREPAMLVRGAAYTEKNDIGDTYVEVDLTNQHVYCIYEGELVVEADCVTGSVAAGHSTPDGLYSISYKASPAVLKGDDYVSHVSYWMPFNGGIGLHDATWRSSFGGTIYKSSGSHGCVNLPLAKAKEIYSYVSAGTPVICYY